MNMRNCQPPLDDTEVQSIARSISGYPPSDDQNTYACVYARDNPDGVAKRDKNVTDSVTSHDADVAKTVTPLAERVEEWVKDTGGRWFEVPELDRELGIISERDKANRRQILHRLEKAGRAWNDPRVNKRWRYIDPDLPTLDYKGNDDSFTIHYFTSEGGETELRDRLTRFPDRDISEWNFLAHARSSKRVPAHVGADDAGLGG